MIPGNRERITLEDILDQIWKMLEQGVNQSDDPFHQPVLGTLTKDGCSLRTVILRKLDVANRILVCHSDARAVKIEQIRDCPRVSWLFYHPQKKIQLRVTGQATLHAHDSYADRQWGDTGLASRLNYATSQPPGTPIDKPSSGLPDFLLNKIPTLIESEKCRKNFMVISARIDSIDWLMLKVSGNRRARFEWDEIGFSATWLVP